MNHEGLAGVAQLTLMQFAGGAEGLLYRGEIVARAVFALVPIVTRAVLALRPVVPLPVFALGAVALLAILVVGLAIALLAIVALPGPLVPTRVGRRFGLGLADIFAVLAAFVLEIDVVAGSELVSPDDLADRPLRLHGAQDAEIVLGVLQIVLRQHPVTR